MPTSHARNIFGICFLIGLFVALISLGVYFFWAKKDVAQERDVLLSNLTSNVSFRKEADEDEDIHFTRAETFSSSTGPGTIGSTTMAYVPSTSNPSQEGKHQSGVTVTSSSTDATVSIKTHSGSDNDHKQYELRLNRNGKSSSGIVYIERHDEELGFLCADEFTASDATVVCRELGYTKGMVYHSITAYPYHRYTHSEPILTNLSCSGEEKAINECSGFQWGNYTTCSWWASVICYNKKPYSLRLVNGLYQDSGMIEMEVGGVWGILCAARFFNDDVADILCRTMNFTGGLALDSKMIDHTNHTKVWVPYVSCHGGVEAKSLFDCEMTLHTENILTDLYDSMANLKNDIYLACLNKPVSHAATVQCFKQHFKGK
ncbi:C163B-like protein [Mya arenaria]|uniref:C163B-like protein n=1 Tax=Mya arenaria TaxID=6604 RepID=A0ABY7D9Z5_MYAAR|nr:scavenger receptor cysteine-rich type 1 protein M130-like [Mya arenaria]WAQ93911.1 C163B-like protein [Mya arenaria]